MKNLSKNFLWALVALMLVSALYSIVAGRFAEEKEISLSELVAKINAEEVREITVTDSTLQIVLKNGEELTAQKEVESGLSETLNNYGVEPQKLQKVSVKVESSGFSNFLLGV